MPCLLRNCCRSSSLTTWTEIFNSNIITLYISCNPETLAQNIAQLHDTHRIERCALFDQFPYTHHMESGVLLVRRG